MRVIVHRSAFAAVTSLGCDWSYTWDCLQRGKNNFGMVETFVHGCPPSPPVSGIDCWPNETPPIWKRTNALVKLASERFAPSFRELIKKRGQIRIGLVVGTSNGESGPITAIANHLILNMPLEQPFNAYRAILIESLADTIRDVLKIDVPSTTFSGACASGGCALGIARDYLRSGYFDVCVVATVDALSRISVTGFKQIGAMSRSGCRPFDKNGDGTTVGEGAVILLLAREGVLPNTNGDIVVAGYGENCDARHAVEPSGPGVARAIECALNDASIVKAN